MNGSDFGVGLGVGLILGIAISMILDKWYKWKDEIEENE